MYTYRQIFSQAIKIAWQNPGLWVLGLLVAMLGSSGELELLLSSYGFGGQGLILAFWQGLAAGGLFTLGGLANSFAVFFSNPFFLFIFILLVLLVLAVSILMIWLINVCLTALIDQIINISRGQTLSLASGFGLGLVKFWPILVLNVLLRLISWALFGLGGLFILFDFPGSALIALLGFDLILILILIISFIGKYAICGVVLKDWKFKEAISAGWQLFKRNWLLSLEIAFILFLIYFVINSLLAFYLPLILFYFLKIYAGFWFGLALIFLLLFLTFIFIQIILTIFHWAAWSIIFVLLTNKKATLVSRLKTGFRRLAS